MSILVSRGRLACACCSVLLLLPAKVLQEDAHALLSSCGCALALGTFLCRQRHNCLAAAAASEGSHDTDHDQAVSDVLPAMQHECAGRCCLDASRKLPQNAGLTCVCLLPCSTRHSVLGPAVFEASHELLHVEGDRLHAVCASNAGKPYVLVTTSRHSSQLSGSAEEHQSVPEGSQAGECSWKPQQPHLCRQSCFSFWLGVGSAC